MSSITRAVASGFCGGSLTMATLPVARAAAAFSIVSSTGKLKGMTVTTTPSGTRSTIVRSRSPPGRAPVGAIAPDHVRPSSALASRSRAAPRTSLRA
jgi:hypothetical protein